MSKARKAPRTVAIIGAASSWRHAPWHDRKGREFWGLPAHFRRTGKRFDRVVEVHVADHWSDFSRPPEHVRSLQQATREGTSVVLAEPHPDVPGATLYPMADVLARFGPLMPCPGLFASSVDYMVALALLEGCTRIELYGINMTGGREWEHQRAALAFWCGVAVGEGTEVHVAKASPFLRVLAPYGSAAFYDGGKRYALRRPA